ncbi:MAG: hypothetical protein ACYS0D_01740 [Planctomycetota bacterium]
MTPSPYMRRPAVADKTVIPTKPAPDDPVRINGAVTPASTDSVFVFIAAASARDGPATR